jgi:hypothetical protein
MFWNLLYVCLTSAGQAKVLALPPINQVKIPPCPGRKVENFDRTGLISLNSGYIITRFGTFQTTALKAAVLKLSRPRGLISESVGYNNISFWIVPKGLSLRLCRTLLSAMWPSEPVYPKVRPLPS